MNNKKIVVGTRGSRLALLQCYQSIADIQDISKTRYNELIDSEFKLILTTGDKKQGTLEAGALTKKAWVDKIEEALINRNIDIAIHSGKDIPKEIASGTRLMPIGKRADPFDVFIGRMKRKGRIKFAELNSNSSIGTASLRRNTFIRHGFPNMTIKPHRGNVPTRIAKLDSSENLDGIILAAAGLARLGLDLEYERLTQSLIVPSALQGTLVAQFRNEDSFIESLLNRVLDDNTNVCFQIERVISEMLGADCKSCIGIYAEIKYDNLYLTIAAVDPVYLNKLEIKKSIVLNDYHLENLVEELELNTKFMQIKKMIV